MPSKCQMNAIPENLKSQCQNPSQSKKISVMKDFYFPICHFRDLFGIWNLGFDIIKSWASPRFIFHSARCTGTFDRLLRNALFLFGFLLLTAQSVAAPIKNADMKTLEQIPVQSGGRIKPFSSFAREVMIFVTGREKFNGQDPAILLFEWLAAPENWEGQPLIPVPQRELRDSLGISNQSRISPKWLSSHSAFMERAEKARSRNEMGETLTFLEQKELDLYQKMNLFYSSSQGKTWTVIPPARFSPAGENPAAADRNAEKRWLSLDQISSDANLKPLQIPLGLMIENYRNGNSAAFRKATEEFIGTLGWHDSFTLETHYNRLRPFRWAWCFYLSGFLAFLLAASFSKRRLNLLAFIGIGTAFLGFILHTYGFILRCAIAGRPPVSNMYESVVWVSWAVVFFSVILFLFYRSFHLIMASSLVATLGLILADNLPAVLDPSIGPLVPVLRNNFWLTIHVLTITLSYGAFALALGLGHLTLLTYALRPQEENLIKGLTQFLYRAIQIGVILLASGTILGGVWANYSWGRFWGWDPKETWALIALLGYLALLHCRFTGWVGPFGLAVGSVVGFLGILMAWYGVNFVLASGLHSYGFGGGGLPYVGTFVVLDLLCVGSLVWLHRRRMPSARTP